MASGSVHTMETHRPNPVRRWIMSGLHRVFEFEFIINIIYLQSSRKHASSKLLG